MFEVIRVVGLHLNLFNSIIVYCAGCMIAWVDSYLLFPSSLFGLEESTRNLEWAAKESAAPERDRLLIVSRNGFVDWSRKDAKLYGW